ncbi:MAG: outer membrane beta-barrel protein [Crocinitomix sp.]|nr:outer membrane beta-barrel protein [Crocinitomix sp.]
MRIKYSLNQTLIGKLLLAFLLCCGLNGYTQISGGDVKPDKDKKDKKEKTQPNRPTFERDSLSGTAYYLTGMVQRSFRHFEDQSVYDVHAALNDEVPMITGGTTLGLIMPLSEHFGLDAGITYFGHGEAYDYSHPTTDSTFGYTHVYMQIGIPLKLRYTYGEDLQFFGYAGLTPLNILNIRNKFDYSDSLGVRVNGLTLIKDGFTTINFMASAGIGMNYYINHYGFTLSAEYRRHLGNTFSEDTFKRVHKMYGIGINLGFQFRL